MSRRSCAEAVPSPIHIRFDGVGKAQILFEIIGILIVMVMTSGQFGGEWLSQRVDQRC